MASEEQHAGDRLRHAADFPAGGLLGINRIEGLLDSETPKDPENLTELLMSCDEAFKVLKSVCREQLGKGTDLQPIESIVFDKAGWAIANASVAAISRKRDLLNGRCNWI